LVGVLISQGGCGVQYTEPLQSIGAFSVTLLPWNRSLYLRFDLSKTSSDFFETERERERVKGRTKSNQANTETQKVSHPRTKPTKVLFLPNKRH